MEVFEAKNHSRGLHLDTAAIEKHLTLRRKIMSHYVSIDSATIYRLHQMMLLGNLDNEIVIPSDSHTLSALCKIAQQRGVMIVPAQLSVKSVSDALGHRTYNVSKDGYHWPI